MTKHRVAVLKVVSAQLSVTAAAAEYGISRGHLHRLLRRFRDDGLEAVDPRSRRPRTNPGRTTDHVRERIVALRTELAGRGLDAGPVTIAWHLGRASRRPVELDHPAHPPRRRPRRARLPHAPTQLV